MAILVALMTLVMYLLSMPQSITLEDAGLFQMVCTQGGLSHPPGYPLFTLICQNLLPTDHISGGNLLSVFFAVATLLVFYALCTTWFTPGIAATCALLYGLSTTFWHQAIIIEVYTLAAFLFYLDWLLIQRFVQSGDWRYWFTACLVFGLGLSNHWPLMLLGVPALFAVTWPQLKHQPLEFFRAKQFIPAVLLFAMGLLPYATLFMAKQSDFGVFGPVTSFGDFVDYVLRSYYNDDHAGTGLQDKIGFIGWLLPEAARQYGVVVLFLALAGLTLIIRDRNSLLAPTLLSLLGATVVLVLLLGFTFDAHGQSVFRPYPIIAWGSLAVWVGYLLQAISEKLKDKALKAGIPIAVVLVVALTNYPAADRRQEAWVEDYFVGLLSALPPDAVLFTDGDLLSFPLGYLHYVEDLRPDITLLNWSSLTYPNRLTPATSSRQTKEAAIIKYVGETRKPIFVIEPRLAPLTRYGWFNEINRKDRIATIVSPAAEQMLDVVFAKYINGTIRHQLDLELADFILASFTKLYLVHQSTGNALDDSQRIRFESLLSVFPGKMMLLEHELNTNPAPDTGLLLEVYNDALTQIPVYLSRKNRDRLESFGLRIQALLPVGAERQTAYEVRES